MCALAKETAPSSWEANTFGTSRVWAWQNPPWLLEIVLLRENPNPTAALWTDGDREQQGTGKHHGDFLQSEGCFFQCRNWETMALRPNL